ncbi:sugar ABC transporter permease [Leptothermofonsia sichuanensis E412]|uniref:carbohydrate ABC transporter permease n=1 Tax=Leptothermofonsia sichuanensis TaxID=2917832 RepID=UPI001CA70432|nr:sugar ABC transporter permease [Leptothermofonsia sichuanensis]QZZ22715.1 sugar ABC transporter permease [Leptothermofonsia sichuanensis E412]
MPSANADTIQRRDQRTGLYLLIPAVIMLLLVFAYPIGRSLWLSFFDQNLATGLEPVFAGLNNYARIAGDGRFWQSFWITTRFTVITVVLELILGMGIALVLNQAFRGRNLVRTIAILPWALPTALIALGWTWIFNDQYGIVNDILLRLGLIQQGINWLGSPFTANLALIVADVWKTTPFISILLLAGLQSIPGDLYEAHALEGATPWQSFYRITLPLLMPQIIIAMLFRFAQAFGIFDLMAVMTGGGPGGSTEVVSLYIYATAMRYLDFGYSAAMVVVTFLLLIIAVLICAYFISLSSKNRGRGEGWLGVGC